MSATDFLPARAEAGEGALVRLTAIIARELHELDVAGAHMIERAIRVGKALIVARKHVPHGEWETWLLRTFPDRSLKTHRLYMRIAANEDEVRRVAPSSLNEAHALLAGGPRAPAPSPDQKTRALELVASGMSYRAAGAEVGVSHNTICEWMNPGAAERRRERRGQQTRTAQRRATEQERLDIITEFGGELANAYLRVGAAIAALQDALAAGVADEVRPGVKLATTKLRNVEDVLAAAARAGLDAADGA